jgi:hypothetical protein
MNWSKKLRKLLYSNRLPTAAGIAKARQALMTKANTTTAIFEVWG